MTHVEDRVVVGVSLSLSGLQALRYGIAEARRRDLALFAVCAYFLNPALEGPEARLCRDEMAATALRTVHEAFDAAAGGLPEDVEVTIVTVADRADLALTRVSAGRGNLLVLGGRAPLRRMNWIVRYCLRRATCPVVVVPPPELAGLAERRGVVRALFRDVEGYMNSLADGWRPRRD
jgi:hypothetical protein